MTLHDGTIKTKRPCDVDGCDEPMIGLGRLDNPYKRAQRGYSIGLCPAHYGVEQELSGLDPFTR
jgi:hypothetical protein